jgi:hypothetical protein
MSLTMTGAAITLVEKLLVPGDFVPYTVLYETDSWQGPEIVKQPAPSPLEVKQFGADPHAKLAEALGSMMDKKLSTVISNKALINRRDWR